ncbi:MAG TPA: HAMP domain-containing protein, partial [Verrucomicrobiae bacterium]|nr:HAMP domain-containing protein [Verrucomicrobiae bacterium]
MNTRSLRFRLVTLHAVLMTAVFLLLGVTTVLGLKSYQENTLRATQLRRVNQIAQSLAVEFKHTPEMVIMQEIEARYAPGINNQLIRVTRMDGAVLYLSTTPKDHNFDPRALPPADWHNPATSARHESFGGGEELLIVSRPVQLPDGHKYLVESGGLVEPARAVLRRLIVFLAIAFPFVLLAALGVGYSLVNRALRPVDQITSSAEGITSRNLSERLPVARTGDELERLSVALNHMIARLDENFQQSRRFVADASH